MVLVTNCQVCGDECLDTDLRTMELVGFGKDLSVCKSCLLKTAERSLTEAADILSNITKIVKSGSDPESRLSAIMSLLEEK